MFQRCPKCHHQPLPQNQALPAACPACGVILAKVAQRRKPGGIDGESDAQPTALGLAGLLFSVPQRVDVSAFWLRVLLLAAFCGWGLYLIAMDYRTGEMGGSFIHGPLLVFHEAGHVVFRPFGEWVTIWGGTLGQLLMPAVLTGALLLKNRDPFGASIGLWLLGVSLLDVAPYMFDALHPELILLSGTTGEEGGHDWIFLFSSMGLLSKAQVIGALTHKLGALLVLLAVAWGVFLLKLEFKELKGPGSI